MTTEELLALGLSQEQANAVFAINGTDITSLRGKITALAEQNTALQAESAELATLKKQNMTTEQLQQKAIDDAIAEKAKYTKLTLSVKARESLIKGGLAPDEIDEDLLGLMVGDDEEKTATRCQAYTSRISAKLEAKETQLREELLKGTPDPQKDDKKIDDEDLSTAEKFAKSLANSSAESKIESAKGIEAYTGGK